VNSNRRNFLKTATAVATLTGLKTRGAQSGGGKKPNLLFVFTDQQSFDMLGCYGNDRIQTPNLDKLAEESVRFEYCISSNPVCTPMRAMLLSGQHNLKNGAFYNDFQMLPGNGQYFAEVLKNNGYRTGYVGKWHLHGGDRDRPIPAGPYRYGFDDVFLSNNCTLNFDPDAAFYFDQKTGQKIKYNQWEVYGQTEQAKKFINESSPNEPWALFVSWHPPHDHKGGKYTTLPELENLYDPDKIKLRPSQTDSPEVRKNMQGYMAMITGCDIAFGQLMKTLKEKGMDDNTIVVFTSDHGDLHGAHGRPWAKSFPEDESCRVPLIIRYPETLNPRTSELLVGTLDLMPTILDMMGMPVPASCDGQNLAPHILAGNDHAVDSVPLFYYAPSWRGVFTKDFTYSERAAGAGSHEKHSWNTLYDRSADPRQLVNRFDEPQYAGKKEELKNLMWKWLDRYNDPFLHEKDFLQTIGLNYPNFKQDGKGVTGRLPGRPVDLLNTVGI
jgi:arylsulfatase A-like enzyme